jgi:chromosome partitioning protein
MQRILIASSKGGCGKTTVTTNLAVALAHAGRKVWLIDADSQGSSVDWAAARGNLLPAIPVMPSSDVGHGLTQGWTLRIPPTTDVMLVDTPAGLRNHQISEYLRRCDTVLIPIVPSAIDMRATQGFLNELRNSPAVRSGTVRVGLIANRVKTRTLAARDFMAHSDDMPFQVLTSLRDTQAYVLAGALGRGIFDYQSAALAPCRDEWQPVLNWLARAGAPTQPQPETRTG